MHAYVSIGARLLLENEIFARLRNGQSHLANGLTEDLSSEVGAP
jgi:hypothetical protein